MSNLILWNCLNIPSAPVRTLGAHHIASWLRCHGYTVHVIDFCHLMTTDDLVAITEKHIGSDTLAIGVSSTFWADLPPVEHRINLNKWNTREPNWVLSARQKLINKKLYWLLGGLATRKTGLVHQWVLFHGLSEDSILKWMDNNSSKLKLRSQFDITTSTTIFSRDNLILPSETLPIELGRGCQFKCKFCSFALIGKKKGTYIRPFDLIREEVIRNYNEFGTTKYFIMDDTTNESEEKIISLANMAQSLPFKFEWTGYNRLDLIWSRPNTIQLLKDSGLKSTFFGIETFHKESSMLIGKGWNGQHAKEFLLELKSIWKWDITWLLSFIVGFPGETIEDIEKTFAWCVNNNMYHIKFHPLFISKFQDKQWKSQFDIEYEKYGYSFPTDDVNWVNDNWTFQKAQQYSQELDMRYLDKRYLTSWTLFEISTLGESVDYLKTRKLSELPWTLYKLQTRKFVDSYVARSLL